MDKIEGKGNIVSQNGLFPRNSTFRTSNTGTPDTLDAFALKLLESTDSISKEQRALLTGNTQVDSGVLFKAKLMGNKTGIGNELLIASSKMNFDLCTLIQNSKF